MPFIYYLESIFNILGDYDLMYGPWPYKKSPYLRLLAN